MGEKILFFIFEYLNTDFYDVEHGIEIKNTTNSL